MRREGLPRWVFSYQPGGHAHRAQIATAVLRLKKDPGVLEYLKFAIMHPVA
jgi:hypothetical protein